MNDLLLARTEVEGVINLALGDPKIFTDLVKWETKVNKFLNLQYPSAKGFYLLTKLLEELNPGYHAVVTNGAKHAISAAFWALDAQGLKQTVYHKLPYWLSYPTLASLQDLRFDASLSVESLSDSRSTITVVTSPNNPDGDELGVAYPYGRPYDIWDAVYASPIYNWSGKIPEHLIKICSASKSLGIPGVRVGWLLTRDKILADAAQKYVEITTSGVGVLGQDFVARCLINHFPDEIGQSVKDEVQLNALMLNTAFHGLVESIEGVGGTFNRGMFAWVKPLDYSRFCEAFRKAKVSMVEGFAFGKPGYVRLNMFLHNDIIKEALTKVVEIYGV